MTTTKSSSSPAPCAVASTAMLLTFLVGAPANADEDSVPAGHPFLVELGADATLALGTICERNSDMEGCSPGQGAAGFSAHAGWMLGQRLSLGVFAAYQWAPNDAREGDGNGWTTPFSETVLWMAAETRWLPWSPRFYVSGDVGVARYHQEYHPYAAQNPAAFASQWAPAVGLGTAWILFRAGRFTVAIDLHAWITFFGSDPPAFGSDRTAKKLGVLPWFAAGLQLGFRP